VSTVKRPRKSSPSSSSQCSGVDTPAFRRARAENADTALAVSASDWPHRYTREQAAYPLASLRESKYWCPVARVDNVYGDRNLFCSCVPVDEAADAHVAATAT
jgi:hypothetical protein